MLIVFAVIFSISSIIISYGIREDNDPLLILKLIALYILSVVTVSFNKSLPIPIGFLAAYLIALKSKYDKKAKKVCTLEGLIAIILCTLLNLIQ